MKALLIASLICLAACSPSAQESAAPVEAKKPAPPTDTWLGKWIGVEGNVLEVGAGGAPGVYSITEGTLDGTKLHVGTGQADMTITFEEAGKTFTIRAGSGADTGLKYLADKTNCLVIESGRGFCR